MSGSPACQYAYANISWLLHKGIIKNQFGSVWFKLLNLSMGMNEGYIQSINVIWMTLDDDFVQSVLHYNMGGHS